MNQDFKAMKESLVQDFLLLGKEETITQDFIVKEETIIQDFMMDKPRIKDFEVKEEPIHQTYSVEQLNSCINIKLEVPFLDEEVKKNLIQDLRVEAKNLELQHNMDSKCCPQYYEKSKSLDPVECSGYLTSYTKTDLRTKKDFFEKLKKSSYPIVLLFRLNVYETSDLSENEGLLSCSVFEKNYKNVEITTICKLTLKDFKECRKQMQTGNTGIKSNAFTFQRMEFLKSSNSESNFKKFSCSECHYQCNKKIDLRAHILTHFGVKLFKCDICSFKCNRKDNLSNHMLVHLKKKLFKCFECNYTSIQKRSLKNHVLNHSALKLFKCANCNFRCKSNKSLKEHLIIHSGIKPFNCSDCNYECYRKVRLREHILLTHSNIKLFECSECSYKCNRMRVLRKHMLRHSEKRNN